MAPVNRLDELEQLEKKWRDERIPALDRAAHMQSFCAKLFDSAPALLAVARAAVELIEDIDQATGPDEWYTGDLRVALDKLMKGESL